MKKLDLLDGEKILLECNPSPIEGIFSLLVTCALGISGFIANGSPDGNLQDGGCLWVIFGLFVIVSLCFFIEASATEYIITNKRVIINKNVLITKSSELNLNKLETVSVNEFSFGIGTVLATGTGVSAFIFKNVPNFKKFKETLVKARDEFNLSKNTPVNNVVVQQRSKVDELKELKALLDSGALTQKEFDIEKQKILSKN